MIALINPFITCARNAIWEYKFFEMFEIGHLTHNALKSMVSQKNMRMSAATNKDYSEGEINSIMFGDTNEIWACVWRIPDFVEDPLVLVSALYFTFSYMGWYAFIILGMVFLQIGMGYLREKAGNKIDKEQKEKNKDRMRYINESFHNIKGIKLYGWENKLLGRIEDVY